MYARINDWLQNHPGYQTLIFCVAWCLGNVLAWANTPGPNAARYLVYILVLSPVVFSMTYLARTILTRTFVHPAKIKASP
jgi:hypothetical protein